MRTTVLRPLRNLHAFGRAYGALLRDLLATCRNRVALVVALSFVGIALQFAALGVALYYVSDLTAEESVAIDVPVLSSLDLPVSASALGIAAWGGAILLMVIGAAGATYGAEVIGFRTARRYLRIRAERILLSVASATQAPAGGRRGETPTRHVQRMLGRNETLVLRALLLVQRSLRALLMVLVAAVVLAVLNPLLTAIVGVVALAFAVPFYLVNRRLVEAATHLEDIGASSGRSIRQIVDAATTRQSHPVTSRMAARLYRDDPSIALRWDTQAEILLARQRSSALLSALFGFSFVAILVTFSVFIAEGDASWVVALTYLVALNVASASFVELGTSVTTANRFLPRVQDHLAFSSPEAGTSPRADAEDASAESLPVIRAPAPSLPDGDGLLELSGRRVYAVFPERVDRLNLRSWLRRLTGKDEAAANSLVAAAFFCGDFSLLPQVSLREFLQLEPEDEERCAAFLDLLAELRLTAEFAALPAGLETVITAEVEASMSADLRLLLILAPGILTGRKLFVLGWRVLAPASRATRLRILESLGDAAVILIGTRMGVTQPPEATHTVVVDHEGVTGIGGAEWHRTVAGGVPLSDQDAGVPGMAIDDDDELGE